MLRKVQKSSESIVSPSDVPSPPSLVPAPTLTLEPTVATDMTAQKAGASTGFENDTIARSSELGSRRGSREQFRRDVMDEKAADARELKGVMEKNTLWDTVKQQGKLIADDVSTAGKGLFLAPTPGTVDGQTETQRAALREVHGKYKRYGEQLRGVRNVDDLVDLNRAEFGSALGGGENALTGALFGYCSGFATRCISKSAALLFGVSYIGLQWLNYKGYVSVRWSNVAATLENRMDLNKDGVVDKKDFEIARKRAMEVLTFHLPSTTGFVFGYLYGFRGRMLL